MAITMHTNNHIFQIHKKYVKWSTTPKIQLKNGLSSLYTPPITSVMEYSVFIRPPYPNALSVLSLF